MNSITSRCIKLIGPLSYSCVGHGMADITQKSCRLLGTLLFFARINNLNQVFRVHDFSLSYIQLANEMSNSKRRLTESKTDLRPITAPALVTMLLRIYSRIELLHNRIAPELAIGSLKVVVPHAYDDVIQRADSHHCRDTGRVATVRPAVSA